MSEPDNKKRKPNYYLQKKKRQYILEPGLKGFLCTCNFREKECIRESYNILNEYADKLCSNLNVNKDKDISSEETKNNSDSEDITEELSKEISSLHEKPSKKRFQVVESGAKNILFIRTTVNSPSQIVSEIINDILTTKQQKARYLLRLLPIEYTCKANIEDIKKNITSLVDEHFSNEPKTFAVAFNHRNNNQISRDEVIKETANIITIKNSNHKVDLNNPQFTIIVEIIRGMCLLSIVPEYKKFKKYNLLQLYESVSETQESKDSKVEKTSENNTITETNTENQKKSADNDNK